MLKRSKSKICNLGLKERAMLIKSVENSFIRLCILNCTKCKVDFWPQGRHWEEAYECSELTGLILLGG